MHLRFLTIEANKQINFINKQNYSTGKDQLITFINNALLYETLDNINNIVYYFNDSLTNRMLKDDVLKLYGDLNESKRLELLNSIGV